MNADELIMLIINEHCKMDDGTYSSKNNNAFTQAFIYLANRPNGTFKILSADNYGLKAKVD